MKTLFFAVLAGLLAFTAFITATQPKVDLKGRTAIFWSTDLNPLRAEQVALFNRLHPKILLDVDPNNGNREKVIVQSQAGVGPDVFDFWGEANFDAFIQSGTALDLTDVFKARNINFEKDVWPLALPWTVKNGRIYAVPANVGTDGVWFHKDLFEKQGVPYPKDGSTLAEFIETAKKMTIRDENGRVTQYGALIEVDRFYGQWLASFGGDYWSEDGTQCLIDSPESIACLQAGYDFLYTYKVSPTPADESSIAASGGWGGTAGSMAYFRRKVGAMAPGGRWWLAQLRDDIKLKGYQLGAVTPPVAKFAKFSNGGTRAVMVNAFSPHRKEAIEFVVYLMEEPYNTLLNDQADALSGVKAAAYTERYVNNPLDPGADFHLAFRKTLEMGVQLRSTPFLPRSEFELYLNRQIDLVKLNMKKPADALRDAKRDIMEALKRNVSRNADLQAEYDRRVGARKQP